MQTAELIRKKRDGGELHVLETISPVVDKHSTGGVGDKVTLVMAPPVAVIPPESFIDDIIHP